MGGESGQYKPTTATRRPWAPIWTIGCGRESHHCRLMVFDGRHQPAALVVGACDVSIDTMMDIPHMTPLQYVFDGWGRWQRHRYVDVTRRIVGEGRLSNVGNDWLVHGWPMAIIVDLLPKSIIKNGLMEVTADIREVYRNAASINAVGIAIGFILCAPPNMITWLPNNNMQNNGQTDSWWMNDMLGA